MPEPMVMSRWKAPSCVRHSPVPEVCQHPFRLIWFNPMNLLTFSEMKRILPSSARRKRKPSMDSRCSSFSRGRRSGLVGPQLFTLLLWPTTGMCSY